MRIITSALALILAGTGLAFADTIYLKNGVPIDGVVQSSGTNQVVVKIGDNTVTFNSDEVASTETNDKTGVFDEKKAVEEAKAQEAELTQKTGLTFEQREKVSELLRLMWKNDPDDRDRAIKALVDMAKEMPIYQYLIHVMDDANIRCIPPILEVLTALDPENTLPILRKQALKADENSRAKAIELLGKRADSQSADLIASGLVDHTVVVRVAAANSAGLMKLKNTSLLLIENLVYPHKYVQDASQAALEAIWGAPAQAATAEQATERKAYWQEHVGTVAGAYAVASTPPLVPPGTKFGED